MRYAARRGRAAQANSPLIQTGAAIGPINSNCWAKKLTGITAITVGAVGLSGDVNGSFAGKSAQPAQLDELLARLERGEFDLVAVGRALLQDSAWLEKVRQDRVDQIAAFTPAAFATLS